MFPSKVNKIEKGERLICHYMSLTGMKNLLWVIDEQEYMNTTHSINKIERIDKSKAKENAYLF